MNPVDTTGLCLLSLDGGGVRGLSTLFVLKIIMDQVNYERRQEGLPPVKPCDIFDLIGGTSTGGLIAIMLGRLEMTVDDCIDAYNKLSASVFSEPRRKIPISFGGRLTSRFDSNKLKEAILGIMSSQGLSPDESFGDSQDPGCRTFVCATSKDLHGIERLRSYTSHGKAPLSCTIWQAAMATSAASGFFDEVKIGTRRFVDGALGANNPVGQVEDEASNIWCRTSAELKPLVKCFISIGTGNLGKKPVEDRLDKFFFKTLTRIATDKEQTATAFVSRWRQQYDEGRFFRFNVEQGLQGVGLAEYEKLGVIETATEQYMSEMTQESRVRKCVGNLKGKQSHSQANQEDIVREFHTMTILSQHHPKATGSKTHYFIPFRKNVQFVGRTDVLQNLREQLSSDTPQRIAIVGLGGIGKTQVALQTAYWAKETKNDCSVFWLPALSMVAFEQACADIVRGLGLPRAGEEDPRDLIRQYLGSGDSDQSLVIVDNADDKDILFRNDNSVGIYKYIPNNYNGHLLYTTRSRDVAMDLSAEIIDLEKMNIKEGKDLWEKISPKTAADDASVEELLRQLTFLPLAITQAAAYLRRNQISTSKYLSLLRATEKEAVHLLSREFHDPMRYEGSRHTVARTWLVSFEQIRKTDESAADLLSFLSQIEPRAIPQTLLPRSGTEEELIYAIGTLKGYAFLDQRGDDDIFDMHRLVHLAARLWLDKENKAEETRLVVIRHIENIFPTDDWENREKWRQYMPHAITTLKTNGVYTAWNENSCELGYWVGRCLRADGRIREATIVLRHVVAVQEKTLDERNPDRRLSLQHALALAYEANGQIKEAVSLLEHIVAVRKKTLDRDHPNLLASQHVLASAYKANGQVKEAINLLKHVVTIQQSLAEDHPDRLASQHQLASAYKANGQVKEAINLLEHVVTIRQSLAEDHPDRLASQHQLALAYQANGQVKEAINLLEHVVTIQQSLAEDHPDRLVSQHNLALAYKANGQVKEAINLLEHVVTIQQSLAENHPARLASQHSLALAYQANGQVKEAINLLEHVVTIRQSLAEDHPDRLASQHELASAYQANSQVKEAIILLEHVVTIRQSLAEDHPARLASQHELASAYQANGQVKEAIDLLEHVAEVKSKVLAETHPSRLVSEDFLNWLREEYQAQESSSIRE